MNKKLLVEVLNDALVTYSNLLAKDESTLSVMNNRCIKIDNIETLLSELTTEPSLEEKQKQFESDICKTNMRYTLDKYTDELNPMNGNYKYLHASELFEFWQIVRGYKP